MTDTLLQAALAGDRDALAQMLTQCHDRIRRHARARLGPELRTRVRTSDILQSTYLDVVRGIAGFEGNGEEDFARWVCHIMDNNLRDRARHFARQKRREPAEGGVPVESLGSPARGPSSALAIAEEFSRVLEALSRLSAEHRRIYVLRVVEGLDYADCARELGKTEVALRSLLMRARAALALELSRLTVAAENRNSRHT